MALHNTTFGNLTFRNWSGIGWQEFRKVVFRKFVQYDFSELVLGKVSPKKC